MRSHVQVSTHKEKDQTLMKRKGSWEGYSEQKAHGSSLAEKLPGKKRGLSSFSWALLSFQDRRVSPSCLSTLFN